jgi:hypothetical protein
MKIMQILGIIFVAICAIVVIYEFIKMIAKVSTQK